MWPHNWQKIFSQYVKFVLKICDFSEGIFSQIPWRTKEILKMLEGTVCYPRVFLRSPNGQSGLGDNPLTKIRILYYFFQIRGTNAKITCIPLTTCPPAYIIFFFSFRRKVFKKKKFFVSVNLFSPANLSIIFSARGEMGGWVEFQVWVLLH